VTTWASFGTRFGYALLVVPLALVKLSTAEVGVWLLFRSVIAAQGLASLGFTPTFIRVIAYAYGGSADIGRVSEREVAQRSDGEPAWGTIAAICLTMRAIYLRISIAALAVLAAAVTWAFYRPIGNLDHPALGWLSWGLVIAVVVIQLAGNTYNAFLQGVNKISLLRRWEGITNLGGIITSLMALILGGGLLGLVIAEQAWRVISVIRNAYLCQRVCYGRYFEIKGRGIDPHVFGVVWPSAWRSGLGTLMSAGVQEASGFLYAQVASPGMLTSYLLALRLMRLLSGICQAPFYSKLPLLARLWAERNHARLVEVSKRGMRLSYWSFVVPFTLGGVMGDQVLTRLGSNAEFPDQFLWLALGFALLVERYGAMHLQLYSTTNQIIWHKAAGISGILYMIGSIALLPVMDVYAFPVARLAAYLGFFAWYSAMHSYRAFKLHFWTFERAVLAGPLAILSLYAIAAVLPYI